MRRISQYAGLAILAVVALLAACSEPGGILAPPAEPPALERMAVLQRVVPEGDSPIALLSTAGGPRVATGWIGAAGGELSAAGVVLHIPEGALLEDTWIQMRIPRGPFIDVQLAPHGLVFQVPAQLSIDLAGTAAEEDPEVQARLIGVYHLDEIVNGTVQPLQLLPVELDGRDAVLDIGHFSGYTLAGG